MNRLFRLFAAAVLVSGCDGIRLDPERQLASIEIEPKDTLILQGEPVEFRLVARDQAGEVVEIPEWRIPQWSVHDHEILQVQEHRVLGVGSGESQVTASLSGLTARARVRVNPLWDPSATFAYVTQVAQNPEAPIVLIANRKGMLRIFLTLSGFHEYDPPEIRVTLSSGQPLMDTVLTQRFPEVLEAPNESSYSLSYNLAIPAEHMVEGLSAHVTYDPDDRQHGIQGSEIIDLNVRKVPLFHQILVPVYSTTTPDSTATRWANAQSDESEDMQLAKHLLPISERKVSVREVYVTDRNWNHPDDRIKREEWLGLLTEMGLLRVADGEREAFYYGVMDLDYQYGPKGVAWLGLPVAIGEAKPVTYAHEVGHNFTLRHAPCPSRGPGSGVDALYPYSSGSIGTWGWDPRTGDLLDPRIWSDMMGACPNNWISWYSLEIATTYRLENDYSMRSSESVLYVWGSVDEDGGLLLEPALLLEGPATRSTGGGEYRVEGFGVDGELVFAHDFTPDAVSDLDGQVFAVAIPYDPNRDAPLSSLTVSGPRGSKTITEGSEAAIAIVTDASTGLIRAIRRNWNGRAPSGMRIQYSSGLPRSVLR